MGVTHALLTLVCLPWAWTRPWPAGTDFWASMWFCAGLAVASNVILVYALRLSDLSVLGPLNAYKAVIGLVMGIFLLGELPTAMGVVGMLLIVGGRYVLVERGARFFGDRGVQLRLAALVLSATEAVFLKRALLLSSPVTVFLFWSILGLAWMLPVLLRVREWGPMPRHTRAYLALGATTGTMQLATLLTFGKLPVGYSLALFQLSSLVSVWLGYRYFAEGGLWRRLCASAIMVAGAALMVWRG